MTPRRPSMAFFPNGNHRHMVSNMSIEAKTIGLLKKVEELSTLCGVEACAIIYTSHYDLVPQTWPADHFEVMKFLDKVEALPEYEKTKFSVHADSLVEQKIKKAKVKLMKLKRENRAKEAREALSHLFEGREVSILSDVYKDVSVLIDDALKDVECRMEELMSKNPSEVSEIEKTDSQYSNLIGFGEEEMNLIYDGMKNMEDIFDFDVDFDFDIDFDIEMDQWI